MKRESFGSLVFTTALLTGCAFDTAESASPEVESSLAAVTDNEGGLAGQGHHAGKALFDNPLPGANGRSCATCHVQDEHTALHPENVVARLNENPADPLFNAIDADDPNAEDLTYEHLKKGLVRVTLTLPPNVDLIAVPPDAALFSPELYAAWRAWYDNASPAEQVVTPSDRKISVWRSVPSIENTAFSGPFLFDGRASSLEEQAEGALRSHSEISGYIDPLNLALIASYERTQFSSHRASWLFDQLEAGKDPASIPNPETKFLNMTEQELRGQVVYERACTACHGGITDDQIQRPDIQAAAFFQVKPDGNTIWSMTAFGPAPTLLGRSTRFLPIGSSFVTYAAQISKYLPPGVGIGAFNQSLDMPRYRLRFYTNGERTEKVTDLPPLPEIQAGQFNPFVAKTDENNLPIVGPALAPQLYSTDPGRALISGDFAEYEGFDVPQLRGIANTAPYFHDNSAETLEDMIDTYSRFILPFIPALGLTQGPPVPGQDVLSDDQKSDLAAFLRKF